MWWMRINPSNSPKIRVKSGRAIVSYCSFENTRTMSSGGRRPSDHRKEANWGCNPRMIVVIIVLRVADTVSGFSAPSILSSVIPASRGDNRHRAADGRDVHLQPLGRQPFFPYLMQP
jgi:hypothetical protein